MRAFHFRAGRFGAAGKLALGCLVAWAALLPLSPSQARSTAVKALPHGVQASVTLESTLGSAPKHYLGLSLDMAALCQFLRTDSQYQTRFENLFLNLGTAIVKVGGRGGDFSEWSASGAPVCSTQNTIVTPDEAGALFAFANRAGAKVIWGLPLARYNPPDAVQTAANIETIGGKSLLAFEIGNEPDIYQRSGYRGSKWSFWKFLAEWTTIRSAVGAAVPAARFEGPEACCNTAYFSRFALNARHKVSELSFHFYAGSRTNLTAQYLLSQSCLAKFITRAKWYWSADRSRAGEPLWISEANTFPRSGVAGVSDSYAAALWLLDFLFRAAVLNVSQVDVQDTGGGSSYDAINAQGEPMPLYYAMLAYHLMVPYGSRFVQTKMQESLNITSYATQLSNGARSLVLVNKSPQSATVLVNPGKRYKSESEILFQAPNLTSTSGVTIGGQSVASDGTMPAPGAVRTAVTGRTLTVQVPADAAMDVTLTH